MIIMNVGLIRKINFILFFEKNRVFRFQYIHVHSPLLTESWLVFVFTLRLLICLNLARIHAWADGVY